MVVDGRPFSQVPPPGWPSPLTSCDTQANMSARLNTHLVFLPVCTAWSVRLGSRSARPCTRSPIAHPPCTRTPLHTHRYARRCEETSGQPPLRAALRLGAPPATQEEAERLSSECPVTVFGGEHLFGGCRECSGKEHELEGSSVSNPRASAKAGQVLAGGKGWLNQTVTG